MEVLLIGKVSLYKVHNFEYYDFRSDAMYVQNGFGSGNIGPYGKYSINNYYVSKDNGIAKKLTTTGTLFVKNFKKPASDYFSDCPELVQKIQSYKFTKKDIEKIVLFYNESCRSL